MTKLAVLAGLIFLIAGVYAVSQMSALNTQGNIATVFSSQAKIIYAECISSFSNANLQDFRITEGYVNTDNKLDAIVQYAAGDNCGSAGCTYELCVFDSTRGFGHVPLGLAAQSLSIKDTVHSGMKDLMLNGDEKLILTWDGSKYQLGQN